MPYITISDGLTIKTPTAGTKNYFTTMYNDTFKKISAHDHTGSGKGLQLGASALQANAITFAKMQQITTDRLLGRDTAGTGSIEQLTVGNGIEFSGSGGIQATQSAIFTSGDMKMTLASSAPTDWLLMNGGTIGDASSSGTARANADTVDLFTFLWNNLANAQAAVSGGRGASAAADFAAHKRITLPDMRQRFPIGKAASGTGSILGDVGGDIDHVHLLNSVYAKIGSSGGNLCWEEAVVSSYTRTQKDGGVTADSASSTAGVPLTGNMDTRNPPWLSVNFIIKL